MTAIKKLPRCIHFAEEIDQSYATDPDVEKFLQQKSGWKKYAETDRSIDLSVDQFWNEFFDNSAPLGFEKLQELMKFWDIKILDCVDS